MTDKAGENGQISGDGAARSPWTKPSVPGCGDTGHSILGGDQGNLSLGSPSILSPAGRALFLQRDQNERRLNVQSGLR